MFRTIILSHGVLGNRTIQIPFMFPTLQNTSVDWNYHVERSNKAGKLLTHNMTWPSGKLIGGTGGLNLMFYLRGNQRDYDNWELLGNPSWNWQNVLEYFRKAENYNAAVGTPGFEQFHGTTGPLQVNAFNNQEPFKQLLFDAAQELGYKQLDDVNANEYIGVGTAPGTVANGVRYNAAKAYLSPAKDRANLHVIKYAHVTKVNIDNTTGLVTGVDFAINQTHTVTATSTKEVVLSAGSIGTPHILQLSGIGPDKYFRRLNMTTVRDLHAGWSLQNHISVPLFLKFNETLPPTPTEEAPVENTEASPVEPTTTPAAETATTETETATTAGSTDQLYNYIMQRKGVFSEQSVFDAVGFFNTVNLTDAYPNVGTHYTLFKRDDNVIIGEYLRHLGLNETVSQPIIDANKFADIAIVFVTNLNPVAMGKVRLRSADPYDSPNIQANNLDRPEDMATLVQGIQLARKFLETAAFTSNGVSEVVIPITECETLPPKKVKKVKPPKPVKENKKKGKKGKEAEAVTEPPPVEPVLPEAIVYGTDQYWDCYIKQLSMTLQNPVGTAKMGPATDRFAVVDERLKVHGLTGLRVIDASVMPKIVSANVYASTIMIAEKGSDLIKEDYPLVVAEEVLPIEETVAEEAAEVKDEL